MEAGRELDALIAEKVFDQPKPKAGGFLSSMPMLLPPYSTDIAAAWKVVDLLRTKGFDLTIGYLRHEDAWGAEFGRSMDVLSYDPDWAEKPAKPFDGLAREPSHSICLAALKAVG